MNWRVGKLWIWRGQKEADQTGGKMELQFSRSLGDLEIAGEFSDEKASSINSPFLANTFSPILPRSSLILTLLIHLKFPDMPHLWRYAETGDYPHVNMIQAATDKSIKHTRPRCS